MGRVPVGAAEFEQLRAASQSFERMASQQSRSSETLCRLIRLALR
jgi:hypothetical protein